MSASFYVVPVFAFRDASANRSVDNRFVTAALLLAPGLQWGAWTHDNGGDRYFPPHPGGLISSNHVGAE